MNVFESVLFPLFASGDSPAGLSVVDLHICLRQRFQFRREKTLFTKTEFKETERFPPVN